jgi:hypothetical protein
MLNLDKFIELKKQREHNKKKCYKTILKQINTNIDLTMSQSINFIIFEIPPFIIGEADYNTLECIDYIINKIKNDKEFKKILEEIKFYEPNVIYIKWNLNIILG